jgi:large exoprotein involved in heme utilization and adhesion
LVANTSGQGNASNVTIIAPDSVSLDGSSTGIGSQVFENAVGNGGSISITTGTLSASNGATLVANTSGQGNAGNVSIIATDSVSLDGVGKDTQVTGIGSQVLPKGVGNGGNISITARSLAVTNGARLITSTSGQGDGGNLNILTRDTVSFDGVGSNGRNSGAFSSVEEGGVGKGGDINITTDSLRVSNGAQLNASSLEQGNAGNLNLTANSVLLDKGGQLIAETASGEGGNINLQVEDLLLMRHNSLISAQAFNNGNGGNIRIKPGLIVAVPTEDSDIVADAEQGNGGNITITTQGIFGLEFRRQRTPKSEITASSQLGISGTVNITRLTVDPSQGLAALPATLVDRTNQIDQGCSAGGTNRENTFAVTGRGGLPQNPNDLFAPDMVQDDFGTPVVSHRPSRESVKPMPSRLPQQLVEAQGWVVNDLGVVTLVAAAPNVTPHSGALASAPCQIKEKAAKGDEGVVSSEELVPVPR